MAHYELIVIGAGPGGYEAALHAAKLGKKVAVVEKREAGGTCLNRGCIPTKTLLHSSQIFHDAKHGAHAGIHTDDIRADMTEIFAYKREISQKLSSGIESLFKTAKIDFLRGTALITAPGAVRVTDAEGGANDYTCDDILIATGSVPSRPPIPGLEFAMTSDELLEGCDHLYRSIVIIGGGVIGIEFATFYADLGCEVTVIEGMDRLLPNMDKELGQSLALILKKQGVKVFTNAMVQSVEKMGEDIALITIRRFDWNYEETMDEFVRTGSDLKNAKLIIIDARSNSGGDEDFIKNWLKSYTGEEPEQKTIISNWGTAMFDRIQAYADLGEEFAAFRTGDKDYELFQGKLLENSTPILLLTDSMSGSAGESIVTYCRTLDNCLVIGGPTRGAQLVGNVRGWTLPNSGIGFQFGQSFHFIYNMENVDGKGYEPDLWCDPKTSLQAVLSMVGRYDLGSAEGVAALRAQLPNILTK